MHAFHLGKMIVADVNGGRLPGCVRHQHNMSCVLICVGVLATKIVGVEKGTMVFRAWCGVLQIRGDAACGER